MLGTQEEELGAMSDGDVIMYDVLKNYMDDLRLFPDSMIYMGDWGKWSPLSDRMIVVQT